MEEAGFSTKEGVMRKPIRLIVFACAGALALAVAALAAASYTPSMGIFQATYKPGGKAPVTVVVAQEQADDPTARIVIYAPAGYNVTLGQAAGTTIGTVAAGVQVLDLSQNRIVLTGSVKADAPANYVSNPCAPGLHEAVWTLNAALPGQPANPIPVYVDHTTGAEAGFSSAKMTVCFRDPTLPAADPRRAPNGLKFLDAAFTVRGIFQNPKVSGAAIWRSIFTPYAPGTGNPNAAGTREAQGLVPLPYSLTLKRITKRVRRGFYRVAGTLNVAGKAPSGVTVALFSAVVKKGTPNFKVVGRVRTKRGKFVFQRRLPKKTIAVFAEREPTEAQCTTTVSAAPCSFAIESNAISPVRKIAPPRKKKK
jgi:hypothetical protein